MDEFDRTRLDALIDLLADVVAKRLDERAERGRPGQRPSETVPSRSVPPPTYAADAAPAPIQPTWSEGSSRRITPANGTRPTGSQEEPAGPTGGSPSAREWPPEPEMDREDNGASASSDAPRSRAALLMSRLALGVIVLVVLINIPLNTQGTALARSIPDPTSLVIRNGLLVKEAGSPEVWVYRDGAFHWITSLDAFEYLGYRWANVRIVEQSFLSQYPKGRPLYVLLKCDASPNIYQLDQGRKRWIVDIPTFVAQGYIWDDVKMVPCSYLYNLPNGDSIPPGHGRPPSGP